MKEPNNRPPQEQGEEVAHYDDAVIGRAFRLSAVAAVAVLLIAGVTIYLVKKKPAAAPAKVTEISAPVVAQRTAAQEIPVTPFREITSEAGISFVHNSGAIGEKLLPETMGGGVTVIDFNHDGAQDLLFINGNYWPGKAPPGKQPTTSVLYQNDGRGKFSDVTSGSGLDLPIYGMGAAVGDFDNDGNNDLFFTAVGGNKLFRNLGNGKFHDVTAAAKVGGTTNDWSTAAAFIDIDNDGDLDLFVGNYVRWSREIDFEVGYKLVGVGRAYGQPNNFEGAHPYLYRNDGNGTFTDISAESGVQVKNVLGGPSAKTLGVAPIDVDQDGWIDLIVANDTVPNGFFHNQKNGTFKEIGGISGVAFDNYGATRGAMGIDAGYFRNDRSLGIVIGNFANEMTALYVLQDQPLTFTDEAITEGIGPASRLLLKFGIFFFDYDLDGRLDVLSCNGHLEEEISKVQKSQNYKQPSQLFWNAGDSSPASF
ncbi:MAG: VCBS repeat-containing protein, partial [Verrucomicrobiota bacterium]|nr:VCBS repeat-containing protein [Verrucomicrobiota bacterium]